jgi:hypothetical protein
MDMNITATQKIRIVVLESEIYDLRCNYLVIWIKERGSFFHEKSAGSIV